MFPDHVFQDRRELAEKMATVSPDYLADNLVALLRLLGEFQASLVLEFQVIQGVKRIDVSDADAVHAYVDQFSDYVDQRGFNLERTSCGAIGDIYNQQVKKFVGGTPAEASQVEQLEEFVQSFIDYDRQFTEQIEPVMDRALAALRDIDRLAQSNDTDDARARQKEFSDEYEGELRRLKDAIRIMSETGNKLIEKL